VVPLVTAAAKRATFFVCALVVVVGAVGVSPALAATDEVTTCVPFDPGGLEDVVANAASGDNIVFEQDCTDADTIILSGRSPFRERR
jgi:hypothetical protein